MKSLGNEFKEFAIKGNVIDLAVAVVIGAAFGKIVSSLVEDIITPLVGLLMGGVDFSGLAYKLGAATVSYGIFIQSIIDFIIVAFAIFLVVRWLSKAQKTVVKKEVGAPEVPAEPSEEVKLLREIRDSLHR